MIMRSIITTSSHSAAKGERYVTRRTSSSARSRPAWRRHRRGFHSLHQGILALRMGHGQSARRTDPRDRGTIRRRPDATAGRQRPGTASAHDGQQCNVRCPSASLWRACCLPELPPCRGIHARSQRRPLPRVRVTTCPAPPPATRTDQLLTWSDGRAGTRYSGPALHVRLRRRKRYLGGHTDTLTRKRSLAQSQYRPPVYAGQRPVPGAGTGLKIICHQFCAGDYLPAVTALSSSNDSRMSCGKSAWLASLTQSSNAILKTAIPASAARLAAGSLTPRWRNVPASAEASEASLISSRSCRSTFAAMTAWRCRA